MPTRISESGLVVCVASAMWLAACSPHAVTPAPTVDYYRAHADEREAQMRKCASDPGALAKTAECENALQANNLEKRDSLRQLPPMNLPTGKEPTTAEPDSKP